MFNNLGVQEDVLAVTAPLLSGSIARIMAATAISPIELLRTKMQYHGPHGSISAVAGIVGQALRREGPGLLWKGLVPTLWRDVPFSGIYWVGLESIRRRLNSSGRQMGLGMETDEGVCGVLYSWCHFWNDGSRPDDTL